VHKTHEEKKMKFYLRLTMEGAFPGSPDHETCEISESTYDELMKKHKAAFKFTEKMKRIVGEETQG
jgi:hypothetical protein